MLIDVAKVILKWFGSKNRRKCCKIDSRFVWQEIFEKQLVFAFKAKILMPIIIF